MGRKDQASAMCMVPLALLCIIMGGGLVGTWVACYYKCVRGTVLEYNYYSAVWTGGLAFISGILQIFLVCCWNKPLKYFMQMLNFLLALCCLVCVALSGYNTYLEYTQTTSTVQLSLGMVLTGLEALLALLLLVFVLIWNCVICCSGGDDYQEYDKDNHPRQRQGVSGPYDEDFFNREPSIYQHQHYQDRPQEVTYGQHGSINSRGKGTNYIIPRASARGHGKENGHYGNERSMVVDGREVYNGGENPRGFYTGSSRHAQRDGSARQNGGTHQHGRVNELRSRPGDITKNRYGSNIGSIMEGGVSFLHGLRQMTGIASTINDITEGYFDE